MRGSRTYHEYTGNPAILLFFQKMGQMHSTINSKSSMQLLRKGPGKEEEYTPLYGTHTLLNNLPICTSFVECIGPFEAMDYTCLLASSQQISNPQLLGSNINEGIGTLDKD